MVSLLSLAGLAAVFAALAALVAWLRGLTRKTATLDAVASLLATLLAMTTASVLYALSYPPGSTASWRHVGSIVLIASPVVATVALRMRCRRSIPRALVASSVALVAVVAWLTIHLKGVRGGWTALEILVAIGAATVAVGSAACLGWWSKRPKSSRMGGMGFVLLALAPLACTDRAVTVGTLELTIVDATTGELTPARVEFLTVDGRSVIAENALQIFEDCGSAPVHNWFPWAARIQAHRNRHRELRNPYTGTSQFYVDGSITAQLPPARYRITATKGIEYRVVRVDFVLAEGQTKRLQLDLARWINLPEQGWYGADGHLHIPRPTPRLDPLIATWMRAEGLHVANLLQMGLAQDVHITPQHGFGAESVYAEEDILLVTGQENPRTHVLGHSIILGARHWIDFPQRYVLYDRFWREAHDQGAVNGYAHWGLGGAEEGLAVWGHQGLLDFIEVLNLGFPFYERWYEALNLGIRIGPTAGTDYPCLPGLPGRERFYANLDGPLEYEAWLKAVRLGRTFVTNGPVIGLTVDGVGVGEEVRLLAPGRVRILGTVRFDPERDDVTRLELIQAGGVVLRVEEPSAPGQFEIDTSVEVQQSTWFALRALGEKRAETDLDARSLLQSMLILERRTNNKVIQGVPGGSVKRPSAAHTAAIWVTVVGTPAISQLPEARLVMQAWLDRLEELRDRFRDDRIRDMAGFPGRGDGIGEVELRANREALLKAIEAARDYYTNLGTR